MSVLEGLNNLPNKVREVCADGLTVEARERLAELLIYDIMALAKKANEEADREARYRAKFDVKTTQLAEANGKISKLRGEINNLNRKQQQDAAAMSGVEIALKNERETSLGLAGQVQAYQYAIRSVGGKV